MIQTASLEKAKKQKNLMANLCVMLKLNIPGKTNLHANQDK